jgi:hypothetical protein
MQTLVRIFILVMGLFISVQAQAVLMTVEFSADAVMTVPNKKDKQTKMFVSKNAVRTEININGQDMVEIVFPDDGRAILLNPELKAYQETIIPVDKKKKSTEKGPCEEIKNAQCEFMGNESVNGIATEKWKIITNNRGQKLRTLHWIDTKRKLALREFFPDGSVAELKMLEKEKVNGRSTEKWQRTLSRPDGSTMKSYQWYDPKLKIAIREEVPGGYVRELRNIKVGKQSTNLFEIPKDFTKIDNQPVKHQPLYR